MNIGKYPLIGGMVQQLNNIDLIANNLANVNTTSYKSKTATQETFSDVLGKQTNTKFELNLENNTADAASYINRNLSTIPKLGETFFNNKIGSIVNTGNIYDFSITIPDTFFVVENPKTNDKILTRDGSFFNNNGFLSTKEGNFVLSGNGSKISVKDIGWEKTVGLKNASLDSLNNIGNNSYQLKIENDEIFSNSSIVSQKSLEGSNVNGIFEMGKLIENHRLMEQMQKTLHSFQEVDKMSNNKIGNHKS